MEIRDLDRRAAETFGEVIAQVRVDHLSLPTPCLDWTVYGLVRHQISDNLGFAAAARGVTDDPFVWMSGRIAEGAHGASESYVASVEEMTKAFADDAVLDRSIQIREFGYFPGRIALSMHVLDCVVHAWDLSTALDLPYAPDAELVEHALAVATMIPSGEDPEERPRSSFAPALPVPSQATALDRLLALVGRQP